MMNCGQNGLKGKMGKLYIQVSGDSLPKGLGKGAVQRKIGGSAVFGRLSSTLTKQFETGWRSESRTTTEKYPSRDLAASS